MPGNCLWTCGNGKPVESALSGWAGTWFNSQAQPRVQSMHVILGNGARPVGALGQFSFGKLGREVDWARSFSSLTPRKCHNGLRPKRSDPDSRLCREPTNSLFARGWKNVHSKTPPKQPSGMGALVNSPLHPGEPDPSGSPAFVAVSPIARQKKQPQTNRKPKDA
jgi:hypothetical protein